MWETDYEAKNQKQKVTVTTSKERKKLDIKLCIQSWKLERVEYHGVQFWIYVRQIYWVINSECEMLWV